MAWVDLLRPAGIGYFGGSPMLRLHDNAEEADQRLVSWLGVTHSSGSETQQCPRVRAHDDAPVDDGRSPCTDAERATPHLPPILGIESHHVIPASGEQENAVRPGAVGDLHYRWRLSTRGSGRSRPTHRVANARTTCTFRADVARVG